MFIRQVDHFDLAERDAEEREPEWNARGWTHGFGSHGLDPGGTVKFGYILRSRRSLNSANKLVNRQPTAIVVKQLQTASAHQDQLL